MERKTLSYYQFSSQLSDKNIVIIEFGRAYTRCGFANEPTPRAIIKSIVHLKEQGKDVYLHEITNEKQLKRSLRDFVESIYFTHLAVSPKDRKVVIVESVFNQSFFRNTLTNVFFDLFDVPSLLYVPDHLMALASIGSSTGLILDLGSREAVSIAVVEGVTLLDTAQFASLGAEALDNVILKHLEAHNSNDIDFTSSVVENIRVRTCFVAPYERGQAIALIKAKRDAQDTENLKINPIDRHLLVDRDDSCPKDLIYPIGDQKLVNVPGTLREGVCELLFEIYGHEHSIATLIIETILASPIDCRKALSENILIVGGLASIPGLKHRLMMELKNIHKYQRYTMKLPDVFKFHNNLCPNNYVCWLGASMFCSTDAVIPRSTTREQWLKDGKKSIKDWSDFIM